MGASVDLLFAAGSGLLFVALGLWVAFLRPRKRPNLLFAGFAVGFGGFFFFADLFQALSVSELSQLPLTVPLGHLASISMIGLAFLLPGPLKASERRLLLLPGGAALLFYAATMNLFQFGDVLEKEFQSLPLLERALGASAFSSMLAAQWFFAIMLALRFRKARPDVGGFRRSCLLLSVALLPYPAASIGDTLSTSNLPRLAFALVGVGIIVLTAALWLRNAAMVGRPESRGAAAIAWVGLVAAVFGLSGELLLRGSSWDVAIARTGGVLVLAYAILRHQLLGLDFRVKWTIRRGTLAAMFVAVFFIVSQVAQNYFAQYGVWIGGVAAGLLLFGLSPLQRLAERVADAAMPGVGRPSSSSASESHQEIYLRAAAAAWRDGSLDRSDKAILASLRAGLGLTREQAHDLEEQAERGQVEATPDST